MKPSRRTFRWTLALLFIVLATLVKHAYNGLSQQLWSAYNRPISKSVSHARQQRILVAEFDIEPRKLVGEGKTYEFGEAWLEAAYRPRTFLVWFSYSERLRWSYLCVRPKSDWYHETYSFSLTPEYRTDVKIAGLSNEGCFTQLGNDLSSVIYYQRVPTDLPGLRAEVSTYIYKNDKDVILGSVQIIRRR